jgi:FkbM family methyltransferase
MNFRSNTNDEEIFRSVFTNNQYNIGNLKEEDVVVDIGSHAGFFALKAWDHGARNIYTYEPFEENFLALKKNTENTTIKTFHKAVRGNYKYRTMAVDIGENVKTQEIKNYGGLCMREGNTVSVITLEDIVKSIDKPIRLLKIDCEGSEYSIIMESPDSAFDHIQSIVGELHSCEIPVNKVNGVKVTHEEVLTRLKSLGYLTSFRLMSEECQMGFFIARKKQ